MRLFIILAFLAISELSLAQAKNESNHTTFPLDKHKCKTSFSKVYLNASENTVERVQNYLLSNFINLRTEKSSLQLLSDIESPAARHITFQQLHDSVPVYAATIKVNLDKNGNIISILDNSFEVNLNSNEFPSDEICKAYQSKIVPEATIKWEKNFFYTGENLEAVIKFEVYEKASKYYEKIINNKGDIIYYKDLVKYFKQPSVLNSVADCTATATIFLPDPLTSAGVTYGNPYYDNSDADASVLTTELVNETIKVSYQLGVYRLDGDYAVIKDIESPTVAAATSGTSDFSFPRSHNGFEDVNAYYHIHAFQEFIQSLGFTNLVNYQINVDAHAWGGQDQSSFTGMGTNSQLLFGEGGVDDAEDADVIIHEYGHAILHSASPNATNGNEMNALDEGDGDYFAASYSRNFYSYNWQEVFSWDGHNEFWDGRMVETTKHYPDDLAGNLYTDAPLWSSTLMEIWGDIGRDTTDKLLLQSMYSFSSGMTMTDAANLFLQSDSLLYGGSHAVAICSRMEARGFLTCLSGLNEIIGDNPIEKINLINSAAFSKGLKGTEVFWSHSCNVSIQLFSIEGKCIFLDVLENQNSYQLPQVFLPSGMYMLKVILPNSQVSFKLLKY